MISALREVSASRFSVDSINVDDLISDTGLEGSSIKNILLPSLPPRVSTVHSNDFFY